MGVRDDMKPGSSDSASVALLTEVKELLVNVFSRFASIGAQLLISNTTGYQNSDTCAECSLTFSYFSMSLSQSGRKRRHHCRVCHHSVCDGCSQSAGWLTKRVCNTCLQSLVRLHQVADTDIAASVAPAATSTSTVSTTLSSVFSFGQHSAGTGSGSGSGNSEAADKKRTASSASGDCVDDDEDACEDLEVSFGLMRCVVCNCFRRCVINIY